VLTSTIAYYQKLGCWTPHVEITRPAFEAALDVFQHAGLVTKRHAYEDVVAAPHGVTRTPGGRRETSRATTSQ
jgi:NitT/TauT family transport system substrate-binding protein